VVRDAVCDVGIGCAFGEELVVSTHHCAAASRGRYKVIHVGSRDGTTHRYGRAIGGCGFAGVQVEGPTARIAWQQNDIHAVPVEYVHRGGCDRRPHLVRDASDEQRYAKPRCLRPRNGSLHRGVHVSRDQTQAGDPTSKALEPEQIECRRYPAREPQ